MKVAIDAVNELKADLGNLKRGHMNAHVNIIHMPEYHGLVGTSTKIVKEIIGVVKLICTVDEFNSCVDELSAATWIDGISLEEWKAGMKNTVIDSHGNELEIGKVYEFSDNGVNWFTSALVGLAASEYQYGALNSRWIIIRECQSPLGTIKKAPANLVDGKAYQFESNGSVCIGIFDGDNLQDNKRIYMPSKCTNIIPLVP
ncbi:MAG: hypothetical protein ACRC0J_12405, partial [Shewanella oncorhynchi]